MRRVLKSRRFADTDNDGDVDFDDYVTFVKCFNQAGNPYKEPFCNESPLIQIQISGRIVEAGDHSKGIPGVKVRLILKKRNDNI